MKTLLIGLDSIFIRNTHSVAGMPSVKQMSVVSWQVIYEYPSFSCVEDVHVSTGYDYFVVPSDVA